MKTKELLELVNNYVKDMNSSNGTLQKAEVFKKYSTLSDNKDFLQLLVLIYDDLVRFNVTSANVLKYKLKNEKSKNEKSKNNNSGKLKIDGSKNDEKSKKSQKQTSLEAFVILDPMDHNPKDHNPNYSLFDLLEALHKRTITGNQALQRVCDFVAIYPEYEGLILNIIDKDLKTRFTAVNINKQIPGLIPVFDVSLGNPYDESTKKHVSKGQWYISRKLDGVRCLCFITLNLADDLNPQINSQPIVRFYSRQGNEFETLDVLRKDIVENLVPLLVKFAKNSKNPKDQNPTNENPKKVRYVLDGEVCKIDDKGVEDFQGVMKEINKINHTMANPKYLLFDMLYGNEFSALYSERHFSERLKTLNTILGTNQIDQTNQTKCLEIIEQIKYNEVEFERMKERVKDEKWEGLILRKDAPYQGKRSNDILKVKTFFREEYKVLDIESSTMRVINDETGLEEEILTMKAAIIEHKGFRVSVGSGFKLQERKDFFVHPQKIIGKIISVQFFEETTDKNNNISLRFPTYLGLYGEKRLF